MVAQYLAMQQSSSLPSQDEEVTASFDANVTSAKQPALTAATKQENCDLFEALRQQPNTTIFLQAVNAAGLTG